MEMADDNDTRDAIAAVACCFCLVEAPKNVKKLFADKGFCMGHDV